MVIELDVSKLEMITIQRIAEETDDVMALAKLANVDNVGVIRAVINNPATTKPIRKSIYSIWKNKSNKREVVLELVECPLDADTTSDILKNEGIKSSHICAKLMEQVDVSWKDLEFVYAEAMSRTDKEFANEGLSAMARREDLSEDLANKLLNYSHDVAKIIATTYLGFLRVDFSECKFE